MFDGPFWQCDGFFSGTPSQDGWDWEKDFSSPTPPIPLGAGGGSLLLWGESGSVDKGPTYTKHKYPALFFTSGVKL